MKFSLKAVRKNKKAIQKEDMQMKKRVISILLSTAMISSMVVAGGVTAHAEENVTLNVFDAHAYGLDEYDEMVKAFEESHPGVTVDVQHAANDYDTLLQSRVNSGDIPDVLMLRPEQKRKCIMITLTTGAMIQKFWTSSMRTL